VFGDCRDDRKIIGSGLNPRQEGPEEPGWAPSPGRSLVVKPHNLSPGAIAYRAHAEFLRMIYILRTEYPTTKPGMSVIGTAMMSHQKKSTLAGADSQNRKKNPVRTPKNAETGRKKFRWQARRTPPC